MRWRLLLTLAAQATARWYRRCAAASILFTTAAVEHRWPRLLHRSRRPAVPADGVASAARPCELRERAGRARSDRGAGCSPVDAAARRCLLRALASSARPAAEARAAARIWEGGRGVPRGAAIVDRAAAWRRPRRSARAFGNRHSAPAAAARADDTCFDALAVFACAVTCAAPRPTASSSPRCCSGANIWSRRTAASPRAAASSRPCSPAASTSCSTGSTGASAKAGSRRPCRTAPSASSAAVARGRSRSST